MKKMNKEKPLFILQLIKITKEQQYFLFCMMQISMIETKKKEKNALHIETDQNSKDTYMYLLLFYFNNETFNT